MLKTKLLLGALLPLASMLPVSGCSTFQGEVATIPPPPPIQVPAQCLTEAPSLPPPAVRDTYPASQEALFRVLAEDAKGDAIGARDAYGALAIDKNACAAGLKAQGAK